MVVPKKPAEPLSTLDRAAGACVVDGRINEPIVDSLVIAIAVVVRDVLAHCSSKVPFPDRNNLRQALRLDRSNESLRVSV